MLVSSERCMVMCVFVFQDLMDFYEKRFIYSIDMCIFINVIINVK